MSGGVDSAVAAARAVEAGHDVTGVHLALARNPQTYRTGARGCCTLEDARDARRAADVIGIPFYVWDLADRFHDDVVEDFVAEYAAGRTPNPCLRCNEKIKFAAVLDRALALGFDAVVTGHHARLGPDGLLRRSVDAAKDQSYVLAVLTRDQLDRALFPLGDSTKAEVRAEAARRGLAVADKPDSHDICFIADGDTRRFLADRLGEAPGDIVDARTGEVVGTHRGAYAYTVGQRRGLALGVPASDGRPRYKIEERVTVRDSPIEAAVVAGSCDLFDRATGTVWDWKLVGHTSQDEYRRKGPGPQYRTQAHLYGLGQENAGETVKRVAICFVARYHELRVHVWTEPYQRQVAEQSLARLDAIRARLTSPEAAASDYGPDWWSQIPTSEQAKCRFCPWFKPGSTDLTVGCPGVPKPSPSRHGFESLIA